VRKDETYFHFSGQQKDHRNNTTALNISFSVIHTAISEMGSVLDAWEACSKIDTVFILVCCVFCWPIIPAVGLGYSGYSTRRSGLASFYPGLIAVIVCSIQWWIIGYSLAYGEGNPIIGGFEKAFHHGVLAEPVGMIPEILFSEFQLIFCATVCAIAVGGACERGRLLPLFPFCFVCYNSFP
jgi:Amt family ammonium transporter